MIPSHSIDFLFDKCTKILMFLSKIVNKVRCDMYNNLMNTCIAILKKNVLGVM